MLEVARAAILKSDVFWRFPRQLCITLRFGRLAATIGRREFLNKKTDGGALLFSECLRPAEPKAILQVARDDPKL